MTGTYSKHGKNFVRKSEGKTPPPGRPRCEEQDNIEIDS